MIALVLFLLTLMAEAGCDSASLAQEVERAEDAFASMDRAAFDTAVVNGRTTLDCLTDGLVPTACADWHRVLALEAFLRGDSADVVAAFHAMSSILPGYELSPVIAPPGHALGRLFEEAKLVAVDGTAELEAPAEGWIAIEGERGSTAPTGRPFVFQRFAEDGSVLQTTYVDVGDPLPVYPTVTSTSVSLAPPAAPKHNKALTGTGIALGVVSGALYGLSAVTRDSYDEAVEVEDEDRIRAMHTATNGLVIASVGTLAVGVTFIAVGF